MFVQKTFINVHFLLWRYSNTITQTITASVKNQQQVLLSLVIRTLPLDTPDKCVQKKDRNLNAFQREHFPHPVSTLDGAKVLYLLYVNAIKGAFTDSEIHNGENASNIDFSGFLLSSINYCVSHTFLCFCCCCCCSYPESKHMLPFTTEEEWMTGISS